MANPPTICSMCLLYCCLSDHPNRFHLCTAVGIFFLPFFSLICVSNSKQSNTMFHNIPRALSVGRSPTFILKDFPQSSFGMCCSSSFDDEMYFVRLNPHLANRCFIWRACMVADSTESAECVGNRLRRNCVE
jgi:hypothetical protein